MKIRYPHSLILILVFSLITGCSGGSGTGDNPISPATETTNSIAADYSGNGPSTQLWGYFDISIDPVTYDVSINPNRHAMFTANIVNIMNSHPAYLDMNINKVSQGADYIDIDLDVSLAHPFPGLPQFNGYDVRGVFMGDGSATLGENSDLIYPVQGTDQFMFDDPEDLDGGGPDGYTRWFNYTEFHPSISTVPLFAYTEGFAATNGFDGTATINPYKYFADDLALNENLWSWLQYSSYNGVFSAGTTATRNYYLRFPNSTGLEFGYAILANWTAPNIHPANTIEAISCSVTVSESLYYVNPTTWGGDLILDVSVFDWTSAEYNLVVESTVLDNPHYFDALEMIPVGGTDQYSTYHVEVTADTIESTVGNEFFIFVDYPEHDYQNELGVPNLAYTDPLSAIFRYDLDLSSDPGNQPPYCSILVDSASPEMPFDGWGAFFFDATECYDPEGENLTYEWDFDNDGVFGDTYNGGTVEQPMKIFEFVNQDQVCVRVTDEQDNSSICCIDVDIIGHQLKNIPLREGVDAIDIGIKGDDGDLWVIYSDWETWIYPLTDFYQSGSSTYSMPPDFYPDYMDVVETGFASYSKDIRYKIISPAGIVTFPALLSGGAVRDIAGYNSDSGGAYVDTLAMLLGTTKNPDPPDEPYVRHYLHLIQPPAYDYDYDTSWCGVNYDVADGFNGPQKLYYEYIKAIDTDIDGESIWVIEQPDYYCSNWYKAGIFLTYSGEYFGDGTDSSWIEVRDLARDMQNRSLVLDYVVGAPLIRVYTGDSSGGEYIGDFGDSDSINGDPLRIDGSDYQGNAVVLHGDSTDGFMVSVFLPEEMP